MVQGRASTRLCEIDGGLKAELAIGGAIGQHRGSPAKGTSGIIDTAGDLTAWEGDYGGRAIRSRQEQYHKVARG